jgi:hypothetical protein
MWTDNGKDKDSVPPRQGDGENTEALRMSIGKNSVKNYLI